MTSDAMWRIIRSILQTVGGGGAALFFTQVASDLGDNHPDLVPYITMAGAVVAFLAQNLYEGMVGHKVIGPQVVAEPDAQKAVNQAYQAIPGQDPKPQL